MNESTRRIFIEYAIVAVIGCLIAYIPPIASGAPASVSITSFLLLPWCAVCYVGYYQCFIVDYLGFTNFSFRSILQVFGRLLTAISRSIQNDSLWFFLGKVFVFALFGWAIGLVRAIIRIKKSMDE